MVFRLTAIPRRRRAAQSFRVDLCVHFRAVIGSPAVESWSNWSNAPTRSGSFFLTLLADLHQCTDGPFTTVFREIPARTRAREGRSWGFSQRPAREHRKTRSTFYGTGVYVKTVVVIREKSRFFRQLIAQLSSPWTDSGSLRLVSVLTASGGTPAVSRCFGQRVLDLLNRQWPRRESPDFPAHSWAERPNSSASTAIFKCPAHGEIGMQNRHLPRRKWRFSRSFKYTMRGRLTGPFG